MSQHQPAQDIPIEFASIGWTPESIADAEHPKGVIVVDWRHRIIPKAFEKTSGCVFTIWGHESTSDAMRLAELLELRAEIVNDGISLYDVDKAFSAIPEFRERAQLL